MANVCGIKITIGTSSFTLPLPSKYVQHGITTIQSRDPHIRVRKVHYKLFLFRCVSAVILIVKDLTIAMLMWSFFILSHSFLFRIGFFYFYIFKR